MTGIVIRTADGEGQMETLPKNTSILDYLRYWIMLEQAALKGENLREQADYDGLEEKKQQQSEKKGT
jgi:hypothetical protein